MCGADIFLALLAILFPPIAGKSSWSLGRASLPPQVLDYRGRRYS